MQLKAKAKDCQLFVRAKIVAKQEVIDREIDQIRSNNIRGLLKPQKLSKRLLEYTGPIGISLQDRLKKPISEYEFYFIMSQVVTVCRKIKENNLSLSRLVLDLRYVYINEITKEMNFVYYPVIDAQTEPDIIAFMERIIYSIVLAPGQNADHISKYAFFIKGLGAFDSPAIERYITQKDPTIQHQLKSRGTAKSGFITDKPKDYLDHYEDDVDQDENTTILTEEDYGWADEPADPGTALLSTDEELDGTSLLTEGEASIVHTTSVFLHRMSSDEEILIDKPVFRLGKDPGSVDYCIADNNAVSRKHTEIVTRGPRYFVIDLGSKNQTFINEQAIQPLCEIEILDQDRLKLANEEFVFCLK